MNLCCRLFLSCICILIALRAFSEEWHRAYERGRDRIKEGNCTEGLALMREALRGNPKADPRTPTYGTMVIEYFPQYYLAICAAQAGRLQEAQRYLKESEAGRIGSSRLAGEFQALKGKVESMLQQQQKTAAKPPVQQQQQQKTAQKTPPPQPPPEKKQESQQRVEPAVRDNTVAINSALREAREALRRGRYDEARTAANRVIGMDSNNREGRSILSEIATRQAEEEQARLKQQRIREVEQLMRRGDLDGAENAALALKSQYPSDTRVAEMLGQIEQKRRDAVEDLKAQQLRATAEREVLTAYYNGNYDQAIQLAKGNLSKVPNSWRLNFYLGCSYAALSMLEESDADARLQLARDYFRRARALSNPASLPPYISPKIIDIYKSS